MSAVKGKKDIRKKRHERIRKKIEGNSDRPRLVVFRSNRYIYAQIINDASGTVMASADSRDKDISGAISSAKSIQAAEKVGSLLAGRAKANNIKTIVFDRGGYMYHGRVKALADSVRNSGLEF